MTEEQFLERLKDAVRREGVAQQNAAEYKGQVLYLEERQNVLAAQLRDEKELREKATFDCLAAQGRMSVANALAADAERRLLDREERLREAVRLLRTWDDGEHPAFVDTQDFLARYPEVK